MAVLGVAIFIVMHIAFSRQLSSMVSDEARSLADKYRRGGRQALAIEINEREESASPTRMLYAVFAPDGRRIMGSLRAKLPPVGLQEIHFVDPREGPDEAQAMSVDADSTTRIVVAVDSDWVETFDAVVAIVFGIAFLGTCLLGIGGAVFLGGYLERRLKSISNSAEAIIGGDIRQRMPVSARRDEFDQLAITLNRMLDRIEGLLENLRQVSNDIAHDLRTPLSRLRTRLEKGALEVGAPEGSRAILNDAVQRLDEVLSLFAAILRIAEVESGETRRYFATVDLSALLVDLAESFTASIDEGGRTFLWTIQPGIYVKGDPGLLAQAFINLLENAQRHTPTGTVIRLTLVSLWNRASLTITDNGVGVPKAELPRITKRFARLEGSRNTAGYGLGLSLVSAVAKLHHGNLILSNVNPGLCARFDMPLESSGNPEPDASEKEISDHMALGRLS